MTKPARRTATFRTVMKDRQYSFPSFDEGEQSQLAQPVSADPTIHLERYRDYLLRYAHMGLRDPHLAEDVVQETFLAAIEARERYSNRSTVKTWLVAILKRKIVDCIRKHSKEQSVGNDTEWTMTGTSEKYSSELLNGGDPKAVVENANLWQIIKQCITHLPDQLSKVITLHELDGASTEEICKVLDTSPTNVWVMLHRARSRLRRCLNRMWFNR